MKQVLIVGSGLTGAAAAVALCDDGFSVTVMEREERIGGLCADEIAGGKYVQWHGPHYFHTDSDAIWAFMSRFAPMQERPHRCGVLVEGKVIPLPVTPKAESILQHGLTDEDIVSLVMRPYSERMWALPWEQLPETITKRVPRRSEVDGAAYFSDKHQGVLGCTYTEAIGKMLSCAEVVKGDYCNPAVRLRFAGWPVIYTGHLDELDAFQYGKLRYRGMRIEPTASLCETSKVIGWFTGGLYDGVRIPKGEVGGVIRISDLGRFTSLGPGWICVEAPAWSPRYYPSPDRDNLAMWAAYKQALPDRVIPAGRAANYRYLDMDDAIEEGLKAAASIIDS